MADKISNYKKGENSYHFDAKNRYSLPYLFRSSDNFTKRLFTINQYRRANNSSEITVYSEDDYKFSDMFKVKDDKFNLIAMSFVLSNIFGREITPIEIVDNIMNKTVEGDKFLELSRRYGICCKTINATKECVTFNLSQGKTAIMRVGDNKYFILTGMASDNEVYVIDPYNKDGAQEKININDLLSKCIDSSMYVFSKTDTFYAYYQTDYDKDKFNFDGSSIKKVGCGPTSMAMILTNLKSQEITPIDMAKYSIENDHLIIKGGEPKGVYTTLFDDVSKKYGVNVEKVDNSVESIQENMSNGKYMILRVGKEGSQISASDHFVVLKGISADKKYGYISDPYHKDNNYNNDGTLRKWPLEQLVNEHQDSTIRVFSLDKEMC